MKITIQKYKTIGTLLLLSAAALLVQGYHPCAEDAEIYLPGVEKILHPELFPAWREFFSSHASLTFFPNLIAFSLRITHLPMELGVFLWQLASIFLLLLACWELGGLLFPSPRARWGGVCLVAALLTIPVAGTALFIMDQYLNPRNLAAFAAVFAVTRTLEKKYWRAFLWVLAAGCVHPLMWVFPFSFSILFVVMDHFPDSRNPDGRNQDCWNQDRRNQDPQNQDRQKPPAATALPAVLLPGIPLAPVASQAYQRVAKLHGYFYLQNWAWYEWLGALAPLALFWWFGRIARRRQWSMLAQVSRAFVLYGVLFLVASLVVDLPARSEVLARLQPMRSLHLLYIVMFVVMGGLAAEYLLRDRVWRWLLLFLPLCAGMFLAQRSLFPASPQVEWPGVESRNPWAQAFLWIRHHTPTDAVFALDPEYMHAAGEDEIGFRCLAQRSRLADAVKDNGVVSMFPPLAEEWWAQVEAQTPWKNFQAKDFLRLKNHYGAGWVVVEQPGVAGLDCVYQNAVLQVCRIP